MMAGQGSRARRGKTGGDGSESRTARVIWIGLLVFLGLCLLGGGSNLPSAAPLVVLRPAAILLVAASLIVPPVQRNGAMRLPLLLLAAFTATIALQLIPLPPALWAMLPGHSVLFEVVTAIGQSNVWRPLSLTPALTLSSLMATLTGWAIVLAFERCSEDRQRALVGVIVLMALASCLIGLLQVIGGRDSVLYFYSSDKSVTGLLANRNHQAALLAATLPLLRVWVADGAREAQPWRGLVAALLGVFILGMILLTGSRSGLVLALVGIVAAYTIAPLPRAKARTGNDQARSRGSAIAGRIAPWALLLVPVFLVVAAIGTGRDLSIQRLASADLSGEVRLRALPTTLTLVRTYFPFGSGFGSFDPVFRIHEPDAMLKPTFFNRAHNDYLEMLITGGILPVIVLAAFLVWAAWMAWRSLRRPWQEPGVLRARAGAAMLLIFAAASLSDYPLRAPLMSAVAAIAACWLTQMRNRAPPTRP